MAEDLLSLDNQALEEFCLSEKEQSLGRKISNLGGWQSNDIDPGRKEIQPLLTELRNRVKELYIGLDFNPAIEPRILNLWININGTYHHNAPHVHPGSLISGTYYVKGDQSSGEIVFHTPVQSYNYTFTDKLVSKYNNFNSIECLHSPVPGKLILFPSWITHHVRPNYSKEDRISISFNAVPLR
jgi:uncharacterized protein (TIGR02466 family)